MNKAILAWKNYWFARRPLHGLGLFRIALGLIFFLYFLMRLKHVEQQFSDQAYFYVWPFFQDLPRFSTKIACLILFGAMISALGFAVGFWTRFFNVSLLIFAAYLGAIESASAPGCFNLMWISLFLMLFSKAGGWGSIDSRLRQPRNLKASIWVQRLIVLQLAIVYLSAAFYKMRFASGWFTGENLRKILLSHFFGQTPFGLWLVDHPDWLPFLGTGSLLLELFIPVLLLTPQYRYLGIALGTLFHLFIYFSMNLSGFFLLTMTAHYILVVPPEQWQNLFKKTKIPITVSLRGAKRNLEAEEIASGRSQ